MPEPYWPNRKGSYSLSAAETHCRFARIRCQYCKLARVYLLSDLRRLLGDMECSEVVSRRRCSGCDSRDTLDIALYHPSAAELQTLVVRRLARVYSVQRVEWTDGPI